MKYKRSLISFAWSILGIIVSAQILTSGSFSLFGYPLLIISLLLALLALWQAVQTKRGIAKE